MRKENNNKILLLKINNLIFKAEKFYSHPDKEAKKAYPLFIQVLQLAPPHKEAKPVLIL